MLIIGAVDFFTVVQLVGALILTEKMYVFDII